MEATLSKPRSNALFYLLILVFSFLAIGLVFVQSTPDAPEFKDAIESGITIALPVMNCNNFRLKDFKSPVKWSNQFRKRGFDFDKTKRMLESGTREMFTDPQGQRLMRITDPVSKDWMVVDPSKCEIWMVAPSTFLH